LAALALASPVGVGLGGDRAPDSRDMTKSAAETPVKNTIARAARSPQRATAPFVNPRVAPGKIRWHASFAEACAAAKKSGKPVLLFHLMGKLDEQFC
jgi:hypothetical protein